MNDVKCKGKENDAIKKVYFPDTTHLRFYSHAFGDKNNKIALNKNVILSFIK